VLEFIVDSQDLISPVARSGPPAPDRAGLQAVQRGCAGRRGDGKKDLEQQHADAFMGTAPDRPITSLRALGGVTLPNYLRSRTQPRLGTENVIGLKALSEGVDHFPRVAATYSTTDRNVGIRAAGFVGEA
jgi:hypothetical protein